MRLHILTIVFVFALPFHSLAADSITWKVVGAPDSLAENIELHLKPLSEPTGNSEEKMAPILERAVTKASRALGYYHLSFQWQRQNSTITISVDPGEPIRWSNFDLTLQGPGASEPELQQTKNNPPFQPGEPINQGSYDEFKAGWLNQARSLGYRDARYTEKALKIDLKKRQADVVLALQTGDPYTVQAVRFYGSRVSDELLNKLSLIKPGDRFQANALANLYGQLLDTGYFQEISILPVKVADQQMAIEVNLIDAAKHSFTTGIGISTDTGPRVRLGWDRPLITSAGHQLHTEARVSKIEQRVSAEYRIPITNPLNHYLSVDGGWRSKKVEDTETQIWETSFSHHAVHSGWQHVYKIGIEEEQYQQGNEPDETVFYVIPGSSWSRTQLKGDPHLPDGGHRLWLSLEASTEALGSDTDFFRVVSGARWFTLLGKRHEVHARLELGAVQAGTFDDVPPSRRFFTGGDQSIRGYDFESLAPKNDDGDLIGGQYLNVAGLEYRWRWKTRWFLALFTDVGRAYNDFNTNFNQGAGFGIHWQSPVGPIRFDIATPVDDAEHDGIRLHLTMGTAL